MSKKQYIVKTIAKGRSRGGTSASVATSAVGGLTDPVLSELKALLSFIGYDKDNNAVYIKKDDAGNARNFYTFGGMASGGKASSGGGGSTVSWAQIVTTGTQIATITINGISTNVYAPNSGIATLQSLSFANKTYDGTTAKTITASDITTILGYTPVSSFNGRTGGVSLLKSDVEAALTGEIDSHYHTILRFKDARSENPLPYAAGFGRGIEYALRQNSVDGVTDGGTYHGVMTLYQWNDNSGGAAHQLAFTDNGNIYTRYGKTEWSAWSIIASREWVASQGYAVASQYLSKMEAAETYRTKTDADNLYHPKGGSQTLSLIASGLTVYGFSRIDGHLSVGNQIFVDSGYVTIGTNTLSGEANMKFFNATTQMRFMVDNNRAYIQAYYTDTTRAGNLTISNFGVSLLNELLLHSATTLVSGNMSLAGTLYVDSGTFVLGTTSGTSVGFYLYSQSAKMVYATEGDTIYLEAYTDTTSGRSGKMVLCGFGVAALTELKLWANTAIVWGTLTPQNANASDLGRTNTPWKYVYANRWYPNPNDTDHYIEYNAGVGAFRVNGNIYATGQVAAGGITTSQGTSRIGVIKIGANGTQYSPAPDGICTIPLISKIVVGENEYTTNNGVCTLGLSWKIGNSEFAIGNNGVISLGFTNANINGTEIARFGTGQTSTIIRDINRIAELDDPDEEDMLTISTSVRNAMLKGDYIYATVGGDDSWLYSIAGIDHADDIINVIYLQCGNMKRKIRHTSGNNYTYETNW